MGTAVEFVPPFTYAGGDILGGSCGVGKKEKVEREREKWRGTFLAFPPEYCGQILQ